MALKLACSQPRWENMAVKTSQWQMGELKKRVWKSFKRIKVQLDKKKLKDSLNLNNHYLFEGNENWIGWRGLTF